MEINDLQFSWRVRKELDLKKTSGRIKLGQDYPIVPFPLSLVIVKIDTYISRCKTRKVRLFLYGGSNFLDKREC